MQVSRRLVGLVALLAATACDRDDYVKVGAPPVVPQQTVAGALPPSAGDTAGTGFYDFTQTLTWAPKKTVEMCTNSLLCYFSLSGKVQVDLDVPLNSYLVDPRNIDPRGVLLVRAINKGNKDTGHYKLRPNYIYTLVAYPDSPGATTSHWELKETDPAAHVTTTVKDVGGPFDPCLDAPPATVDDIGLYRCGEAHVSAAAVKRSSIGAFVFIEQLSAAIANLFAKESPIWKSCPSGCCTLATG